MIKYLLKNSDASQSVSSFKAPSVVGTERMPMYITSLEFVWEISGTADGEFDIILSNDMRTGAIVKTISINSNDNTNNSAVIQLYPIAEYISINYRKNSVTSGNIDVILYYSPVILSKIRQDISEEEISIE